MKRSPEKHKRQPERKRHKEKPKGAEEEGRSGDTQKCSESMRKRRPQMHTHTCAHTPSHSPCRSTDRRPTAFSDEEVGVGLKGS